MSAGLNRRGLMASAICAPLLAVAPMPKQGDTRCAAALTAYRVARTRHETFLSVVLDPAARLAQAQGKTLTSRVLELEDQGNDLCVERHDALRALAAVPAKTLADARLKLRLAWEEVLRFDDDHGYVAAVLADLDRLISQARINS